MRLLRVGAPGAERPAALGMADPKPDLRDGDVVEAVIEGLGRMRQTFKDA